MIQDKISAFPDGNSLVLYYPEKKKLIVGNSEGLIKIFNSEEADLEPVSIDISEDLTNFVNHGDNLIMTNTAGNLEHLSLNDHKFKGSIFRSELPLRDALFINDGTRILCGGDDNKLLIIDTEDNNKSTAIELPDQLLNLSYNYTGEILSVSLANGDIQLYSVINEVPNLVNTLSNVLPRKIHTSLDKIDYSSEHKDELISTKTKWSSDGKYLIAPTSSNGIKVYDRANWSETKQFEFETKLIDFSLHGSHLCLLHESQIIVLNFESKAQVFKHHLDLAEFVPLNIAWNDGSIYIGTSGGEIITLKDAVDTTSSSTHNGGITSLFMDEAEEGSDEEEDADDLLRNDTARYKLHEEDSMLIDEDDEVEEVDRRKRHKTNGYGNGFTNEFVPHKIKSSQVVGVPSEDIKPFSPGSTPWSSEESNEGSNADRRYLFMNSIGYVWAVKNLNDQTNQQSITVSFFDRSIHKDYHFTDYFSYDLCSINQQGALLCYSGYQDKKAVDNGKIYYRTHDSESGSWERKIPLLKGEFISSVSLTNSNKETNNELIIVGTSIGYVRYFNVHGVCINIMKTAPVVTLISSSTSVLFMVNQVAYNVYTYSMVDINQDFKFVQQNTFLPLKKSETPEIPLIKGIFFNEYNDPCLIAGSDDTLIVLQSWRDTNNSKWIPLLNCHATVTEHGSATKKNWKCWPLGLYKDALSCLILKNNRQYPSFPLPLPIELEIKLPIEVHEPKKEVEEEEDEESLTKTKAAEDNAEETFLRALTMGKLVSDSLNDDAIGEDQEEMMERLTQYSIMFDRSLLKMFGEACREARLNKALSVAKMIKTDKALSAAGKIAERMQFVSLASKIGKLREDLVNLSDEED